MSEKEFLLLRYLYEHMTGVVMLHDIAEELKISLEDLNPIVCNLQEKEYINESFEILSKGVEALSPYKVKNAIILAAGMSTRFVPVSYELPKGLISVKGEVMTERLIRQLTEAGIGEIVLVVGYMMEKFLYLRQKYGVKIVVNNEYNIKNTHSSIYAARDYLSNTYIVCADNYYPQNMFHAYEYRAFYCSIYLPGISHVERAFTFDDDGLITDTNKPSHDQWIMYGHAFYSQDFTDHFKPILESYYGRPGIEYMYWETIYAENVQQLPMWVHQCTSEDILEFDSMDELKVFDPEYIVNNRVKVFENICRVLCCAYSDISDIQPIKQGLNNRSFKFTCNGKSYIYRHPGANAANIIDRQKEARALHVAKRIGVDDTLVYIDETEGWKISSFVVTTEEFSFDKISHVNLLADALKKIHLSNMQVGFTFDYRAEADKLLEIEKFIDPMIYKSLQVIKMDMQPIFKYLDAHPWQKTLCHNDLYSPNILLNGDNLSLIDWEFSGDNDIGYDLCKLFAGQSQFIPFDEIDVLMHGYYERPLTLDEKLHLFACAAIIYYYWYIWGVYGSRNNADVSSYMIAWHDKMEYYRNETIEHLQ